MNLSRRVEELWYGSSPVSLLLLPFSWLYAAVTSLRRGAFSAGLFSSTRVPVPVIVIGNITAGGTGKTPIVDWLVRHLEQSGYRPGVISRGYGGVRQMNPLMVTADSDPAKAGDEPVMLARRGATLCVCIDRVKAALHLVESGVDVLISDDGLQHYRLARDLEIVVIDGQRGFGNGRLLPAGPLREPLSRLDKADLLLANGGETGRFPYRFDLTAGDAVSLNGNTRKPLTEFSNTSVWAVAGIGNPERFINMLVDLDIDAQQVTVPDHGSVSLQSLRDRQPLPVLMTEKDAVKYGDDPCNDVWYVPVEVEMAESAAGRLEQLVKTVTRPSQERL